MKSKISFCNGPVFRKNMGRFAPAWLLYTVCLLLGLLMLSGDGVEYWLSYNIAMGISFMGMVNCAYGALAAMLLFGIPVREIDITPLGAVIRTAPAAPNACRDAIVHLAGPAVNLLCAAWLLLPGCTPAMQIFAISSLALALFNLLPIRSLDGGCAAAILLAFIAPTHAQIIGELLSAASLAALWLTAGYLLLLCGGNLSLFVICVFLFAELYLK